jgi:siderophore synthetase component
VLIFFLEMIATGFSAKKYSATASVRSFYRRLAPRLSLDLIGFVAG